MPAKVLVAKSRTVPFAPWANTVLSLLQETCANATDGCPCHPEWEKSCGSGWCMSKFENCPVDCGEFETCRLPRLDCAFHPSPISIAEPVPDSLGSVCQATITSPGTSLVRLKVVARAKTTSTNVWSVPGSFFYWLLRAQPSVLASSRQGIVFWHVASFEFQTAGLMGGSCRHGGMGGTLSVCVAPSPAKVRIFFRQEDGKQRCYPKGLFAAVFESACSSCWTQEVATQ